MRIGRISDSSKGGEKLIEILFGEGLNQFSETVSFGEAEQFARVLLETLGIGGYTVQNLNPHSPVVDPVSWEKFLLEKNVTKVGDNYNPNYRERDWYMGDGWYYWIDSSHNDANGPWSDMKTALAAKEREIGLTTEAYPKLPTGVKPRKDWIEDRIKELSRAIYVYTRYDQAFPAKADVIAQWSKELSDLLFEVYADDQTKME